MSDYGYGGWLMGKRSPMSESRFAVQAWELILIKPVSITIKRGSINLAVQTVRVEYDTEERFEEGRSGALSVKRDIVIFGVKGHPDEDVLDTNIKKADVFEFIDPATGDAQNMKVLDVLRVVGGIQARCEAYS